MAMDVPLTLGRKLRCQICSERSKFFRRSDAACGDLAGPLRKDLFRLDAAACRNASGKLVAPCRRVYPGLSLFTVTMATRPRSPKCIISPHSKTSMLSRNTWPRQIRCSAPPTGPAPKFVCAAGQAALRFAPKSISLVTSDEAILGGIHAARESAR
jgi:hypothetical protein